MRVLPSLPSLVALGLLILGLAAVPLFADEALLILVLKMLVLALFALSLDFLVGYAGMVSLGHAAYFGLPGYLLFLWLRDIQGNEYAAPSVWLALPLAVLGSAAAGALIGALVVRTRGIYFIMVTLAFAQMLYAVFAFSDLAGGSDGVYVTVPSWLDKQTLYWITLAALVGCWGLLVMILHAPFGRVLMGIRVNEHRMQSLGYNVFAYKWAAFVIAAAIAGLAGILNVAKDFGGVKPDYLFWRESGFGLVLIILGGLGTLHGALLGSIAFIGIDSILRDRDLVGQTVADHFQIPLALLIIAVVLGLKHGLVGLPHGLWSLLRPRPALKPKAGLAT